jgi:hypothetical protein
MNEQTNSQTQNETTEQAPPVSSASSAQPADELTLLKTENQSLRHELCLRTARDELTKTLTSENARSPELLFEAAASRLSFDDDGKLQNLSEIIADIKTRFPEQFVTEKQAASALPEERVMPTPSPPRAINAGAGRIGIRPPLTKEMLAAMKPRDILNLDWSDVKQVMES